jgi:hypothetical protein
MVYFQTKKFQFGWISESLAKKEVSKFSGHLVYFTAIWNIEWSVGIFCDQFGIFSRFGMLHQEKYGNPANKVSKCFLGSNKFR